MPSLTEPQLLGALIALAVILLCGRSAGEVTRRFDQPEVLGEFFAGFVLGPSVFGALLPGPYAALFHSVATGSVLSAIAWLGAILLLLIAGMEVDGAILRAEARPGAFAAAAAIIPAIGVGTMFSLVIFHAPLANALYLGIVLSVTSVGVAAKILIEREALRRRYAQVILAAGITSEVLVWLMVAVVSAARSHTPLRAIISAAFALGFFVIMLTLGRRFVFWVMRRVSDATTLVSGQLTLVLVLMLFSAALTQAMGLHPLLGAFVFGVLLSQAPRTTRTLQEGLQSLTSGFFAPVFFVLAGMRVNIFRLGGVAAIGTIVLLFVVISTVKIGASTLGAHLGGLQGWESALVGVGLNMKGGTDVIVALVGVELGLFSTAVYTMYAVVAILTVFLSPPLLSWLARKTPPSTMEHERLAAEERERHAYVRSIERVLLPLTSALLPALASQVVERMALAKHAQRQIFDITAFEAEAPAAQTTRQPELAVAAAKNTIWQARTLESVDVVRRPVDVRHTLRPILEAAAGHDLLAMGAHPISHRATISFGRLQDALIQRAQADVLLVNAPNDSFDGSQIRRILVPINGHRYSAVAGDIAASLLLANLSESTAQRDDHSADRTVAPADRAVGDEADAATVMLLHVVSSEANSLYWRRADLTQVRQLGFSIVEDLAARMRQVGVPVSARLTLSSDVAGAILRELGRMPYQMLVMGAYNRNSSGRPYLGGTIRRVLHRTTVPVTILLTNPSDADV